jgi:hypothetical protein
MERAFKELVGSAPGARAQGCEHCGFTGFRGRIPIVEIVEMNNEMRAAMNAGRSSSDELAKFMPAHWHSIEQRAAAWIEAGNTTVDEAVESLGNRFWARLAEVSSHAAPAVPRNTSTATTDQHLVISALVISASDSRRDAIVTLCAQIGVGAIGCNHPDAALALIRTNRHLEHLLVDASDAGNYSAALRAEMRKVLVWSGLAVVLLHKESESFDPTELARANIHTALVYPAQPEALRSALETSFGHTQIGEKQH